MNEVTEVTTQVLSTDPSYLTLQVYGLAIIISMLVAVMIRVVVSTLAALEKKPPAPVPVPADPFAAGGIESGHVAAISAAVSAMMGAHRIVHIESAARGRGWTAGGRLTHHTSHIVEHRPKQC